MRLEHLNNGDLYAFKCYFVFFDVFSIFARKIDNAKKIATRST